MVQIHPPPPKLLRAPSWTGKRDIHEDTVKKMYDHQDEIKSGILISKGTIIDENSLHLP
ncbi:MAG TPA: hypothetical protein VN328_09835 [Thermodesulfovibrionales bacterium]|nr:hypothetical protein [Thermodesulfovibrionales bacterium]